MAEIDSIMIEFHRLGDPAQSIVKGERYVRTMGTNGTTVERAMPLGQRDFDKLLYQLRYPTGSAPELAAMASAELGKHAEELLSDLQDLPDRLVQLDVVANVSELWAFPFEAALASKRLASTVLTRRIRSGFAAKALAWPAKPRVLFLHAPPATDLSSELIEAHDTELRKALEPWSRNGQVRAEHYARRAVFGPADIKRAISEEKPTHVHVLAHGQEVPHPTEPYRKEWGIRFGLANQAATDPTSIANALEASENRPVVITLAVCDAGNLGNAALGYDSLAQTLHRQGVPVVVASQLPLTKPGSVELVRAFYAPLLRGEDVRRALYSARNALEASKKAGHDWLSLVGYVRLPEGYRDHVVEVGLRAELGMLDAAQAAADRLSRDNGTPEEFAAAEARVRDRLDSLEYRRSELPPSLADRSPVREECVGLIASSYKRLAELLFKQSKQDESQQALQHSLTAYREAYQCNPMHHWCGSQQLALEAALNGGFKDPSDWALVLAIAEKVHQSQAKDRHWAFGTLAEVYLLSPLAGHASQLEKAHASLLALQERAPQGDSFPLESTRRQLKRYVTWWTSENGFFGQRGDLRADAQTLLDSLPRPEA